jgi:hypothetical protein
MASNIEHLARKFESRLAPKRAARRGTRMNAKKIVKELDRARKTYKESRNRLKMLAAELERIEGQIQDCRDGVRGSRSEMLKKNQVLQNMDLADANYAVFYDNNSADVGYIVGGDEHHIDLNEDGEISLTPMNERRRQQRAERLSNNEIPPSIADDEDYDADDYDDSEDEQESNDSDESDEPESDDDNESDDGHFNSFITHPNFRFVD